MRIARLMAVTAVAALVLAVATGLSAAKNLNISNKNFRIVWNAMVLKNEVFEVSCVVTVEGSFHSNTIVKVNRLLIGHITRAISANAGCAGGKIFILNGTELLNGNVVANTLPWHVQYEGFFGSLPHILGVEVTIVGASFLVENGILRCLYKSAAALPWAGIFELNAEGRIIGFANNEARGIPLFAGLGCPANVFPVNIGGVTLLGNTQSIFISLI